eukprot:TRINITY_DN854_c3_g1_i1.p1 TRINITY_DN854_c3_g1~~TRINITY_DN854_c3_g1_i1.p1  ORF type:complete len:164 (-),score=54.28 TRINITY_DN854_c3_g1_i1:6-497(-)
MFGKYDTPDFNEEIYERYCELQHYKAKWRHIIIGLTDDETEVVVQDLGKTNEALFNDMVERISDPQNPKWSIFNYNYKCIDGGKRSKVVLIHWCPNSLTRDTLKESARVKMMSLQVLSMIKKRCKGVVCFVEADSIEELSRDYIMEKVSRNEREAIDYSYIEE